MLTLRQRYRPLVERLHGGTREAQAVAAGRGRAGAGGLPPAGDPARSRHDRAGPSRGRCLRQLVRHGLIAVVQRADATTREVSYGTAGSSGVVRAEQFGGFAAHAGFAAVLGETRVTRRSLRPSEFCADSFPAQPEQQILRLSPCERRLHTQRHLLQ